MAHLLVSGLFITISYPYRHYLSRHSQVRIGLFLLDARTEQADN